MKYIFLIFFSCFSVCLFSSYGSYNYGTLKSYSSVIDLKIPQILHINMYIWPVLAVIVLLHSKMYGLQHTLYIKVLFIFVSY